MEDRGSFKVGAARLKERTLTKPYNERPAWLADVHARLAAAYGWSLRQAQGLPTDLTDDAILERLPALNLQQSETGGRPGP